MGNGPISVDELVKRLTALAGIIGDDAHAYLVADAADRIEADQRRIAELIGGSICEDTGVFQKDGQCPVHGGDACLVQRDEMARRLSAAEKAEAALRSRSDKE